MIAHRSARPFPRRLASAAVASALVAATLSNFASACVAGALL